MGKKTITFECDNCGAKEVKTYPVDSVPASLTCWDCSGTMYDKYRDVKIVEDTLGITPTCDCQTSPCICNRPETETFGLGAKRDKEEIPDYRLIPRGPLSRLAKRYSHGAVKYGDRNWEQGNLAFAKDCLNRAEEHYLKYTSGDKTEDHLAAVLWNIVAVMYFEEKIGFEP